jgi:hypothetical protein
MVNQWLTYSVSFTTSGAGYMPVIGFGVKASDRVPVKVGRI